MPPIVSQDPATLLRLKLLSRWMEPNIDADAEHFSLQGDGRQGFHRLTSLPSIDAVLQRSSGWIRLSLSIYERKLRRQDYEWFSLALHHPDVMRRAIASCDFCASTEGSLQPKQLRSGGSNGETSADAATLAEQLNHVIMWRVLRSGSPRLMYVHSILSSSFCADLMRLGNRSMTRSTVMFDRSNGTTNGRSSVDNVRTSSGTFLTAYADRMAPSNVALRVAVSYILGVPESFLEPTQILRYNIGEFYVPHLDYFNLGAAQLGGQRVATAIVWLNDVSCGGETAFPAAKIQLLPKKGDAVVLYNVKRGAGLDPDPMSLHAGMPPRGADGSAKWIAVLWAHPAEYHP